MQPDPWARIRKVAVLHANGVPPALLGPAVDLLRDGHPGAEVVLLDCAAFPNEPAALAERIRGERFDAAVIFSEEGRSPHALAYLCFLAGVPIRIGMSGEFGGGSLTHAFDLPPAELSSTQRYTWLLEAAGLPAVRDVRSAPALVSG